MAGIYIHIPFCKQACHYCNFHFSTQLQLKEQLVKSLVKEITIRKDYVLNEQIASIYIGGGTPTLLNMDEMNMLFDAIYSHFSIKTDAEITLEANPDDLSQAALINYKKLPINRLSIGVQSFFDEELKWMNRAHKAKDALDAIKRSQDTGLSNITIDLIYGSPTLTDQKWEHNLQTAINLNLNHISAYALTVEPKTALANFIHQQKEQPLNEEQTVIQFELLTNILEQNGFEQYEISNFAKNKNYAVHNTNYWKHKIYLGIGPSAHSYNGVSRSWNIANNAQYLKDMDANNFTQETEYLTQENKINEFVMTGLRTIWGIDMTKFELEFGSINTEILTKKLKKLMATNTLFALNNHFILSRKCRLLADGIASDLFI